MFPSICLTSGLQDRGTVAPPKSDLWETAVSCLSHSDKMFHHLGGTLFPAEGPHVPAGGRMNGYTGRRGKGSGEVQPGEPFVLTEAEDPL